MVVLAWGFTYSGYASNLAFDTYFDVLFYLMAVILILEKRSILILPLSILAALNRETGILIPALLTATVFERPLKIMMRKKAFLIGTASLLLFAATLAGIRIYFGPRSFLEEYVPGLSLLVYNATNLYSYFSIFATFSILPLIALVRFKGWPRILKRYFWLILPLWVVVHIFTSVIAEARLFLVPYVVVLLPAAMLVLQDEIGNSTANSAFR
jgi:hypothetical protein